MPPLVQKSHTVVRLWPFTWREDGTFVRMVVSNTLPTAYFCKPKLCCGPKSVSVANMPHSEKSIKAPPRISVNKAGTGRTARAKRPNGHRSESAYGGRIVLSATPGV
jgi:hypothetical protein